MPVHDRYQSWIAVFNKDLLSEVLRPELAGQAEPAALTASMDRHYRRTATLPTLDQILYANFKTYLPDDLAVKMDRMSMANSLETRSPFLDTALIECVAAVRAKHKVGLRHVKPMLRHAFWPMLPRAIWNRKKQGFGVPNGRWFRGELGTMFADEVLAPNSRTGEFLRRDVMRRLWDEHQRGDRDHGIRFWSVLTLERWLRDCAFAQSLQPPPTLGFEVGRALEQSAGGGLGRAAPPASPVTAATGGRGRGG
jgi:asparagine synthase (glutamine-hydrolysing)